MDSKCVLIGPQVCFRSTMKHQNDVSNMVSCLQVVRLIYSFMKVFKLHIRATYIVFLFVKTENNTFIKICKNSRAGENSRLRIFTDLLSKSPKRSPRFPPGYEGTENMFYLSIKFIFMYRRLDLDCENHCKGITWAHK